MAQQFEDQGGVASSNPSRLVRWLTSKIMWRLADPQRRQRQRDKFEKQRKKTGKPHQISFFFQADDAYSYLAAQMLEPLLSRYDVEVLPMLAGPPGGDNAPELALLLDYARIDAALIAPHYGLQFPARTQPPTDDGVVRAQQILVAVSASEFAEAAVSVGGALWCGDSAECAQELDKLAQRFGSADSEVTQRCLAEGFARRQALGHYSGAMFFYGGEWYWGVDRLYHLEQRLIELGVRKAGVQQLLAPRPAIEVDDSVNDGQEENSANSAVTLEFYTSLRSPYTSIIFDRTIDFAKEAGISLSLRPVLPMVMRGVPATRQKGFYIFFDTAREAQTLSLQWGHAYDPIGDPVRRAYSLFPWAREQGKEVQFTSSFLRAAFFDAVNTNTDKGMRTVVENAELSWAEAQTVIDNDDWEDEMENNRLAMYGFGSWGVPSYRLLDENGDTVVAVWGQDRLWLVAKALQSLRARRSAESL